MKNNNTPGIYQVLTELMREGEDSVINILKLLYNKCSEEEKIPEKWTAFSTLLLFKQGDKKVLDNYVCCSNRRSRTNKVSLRERFLQVSKQRSI